jgi:NAD(P)-dependent dehydrogenase (short-subunit alcohol dehydrogenase family)
VELADKVIVVTGAASGIGEGMARRFAKESPAALILADLDLEGAKRVAEHVFGLARRLDVADPGGTHALIDEVEERFGPVDLYCANAGYGVVGDEQMDFEEWERMWQVNLMSHVYAANRLIPAWVARGEGYFLSTASAAGLLTNLKAVQYSVTKHAAVAFAEWLAVTYGDDGVRVSCLCPQFVNTPLLTGSESFRAIAGDDVLEPDEVAEAVVEGLRDERFLILPHPEVANYFRNKANDYDRWIGGMRKLQRTVFGN